MVFKQILLTAFGREQLKEKVNEKTSCLKKDSRKWFF